jgi:hypothetical protein
VDVTVFEVSLMAATGAGGVAKITATARQVDLRIL